MTKATITPHQPTNSVFLLIRRYVSGADPRYLCPIVNSMIKIGIPAVRRASKYGTKNAPPPFPYASAGNRQIFPSPTAEPKAANTNPALVPHCERVSIFMPSIFPFINHTLFLGLFQFFIFSDIYDCIITVLFDYVKAN